MEKTIKMALGCFMFCSNMAMANITKFDMAPEVYKKIVCASYYDYLAEQVTSDIDTNDIMYYLKRDSIDSQEYKRYIANQQNLTQQKNKLVEKSNRIKRHAIKLLQENFYQLNLQHEPNPEPFLIGQSQEFKQGFYIAEIFYRERINMNSLLEKKDKKEITQAYSEKYLKTCESL